MWIRYLVGSLPTVIAFLFSYYAARLSCKQEESGHQDKSEISANASSVFFILGFLWLCVVSLVFLILGPG